MTAGNINAEPPPYEPNPSLARTIGTLNMGFGAILLACGAFGTVNMMFKPVMGQLFQAQNRFVVQQMQSHRYARDIGLRQAEEKTTDPQEKAEINAQRKAEKARPIPKLPDPA